MLPSGNTTLLIALAGWWTPPLASVAYASAISSGDTETAPSASDGKFVSDEVMPIAWAVALTLGRVRSWASCANTVLSEIVVALVTLMLPW